MLWLTYWLVNCDVITSFFLCNCNRLELGVLANLITCNLLLSGTVNHQQKQWAYHTAIQRPALPRHSWAHNDTTQHEQYHIQRAVCNKTIQHEGSHYPHFIDKSSFTADDYILICDIVEEQETPQKEMTSEGKAYQNLFQVSLHIIKWGQRLWYHHVVFQLTETIICLQLVFSLNTWVLIGTVGYCKHEEW